MRTLQEIAREHPALIFKNEGYQYLDKSKLSDSDLSAIKEVESIIKPLLDGFSEFNNFRPRKGGGLDARVQYFWDTSFCGVGYFPIEEIDTEAAEATA